MYFLYVFFVLKVFNPNEFNTIISIVKMPTAIYLCTISSRSLVQLQPPLSGVAQVVEHVYMASCL